MTMCGYVNELGERINSPLLATFHFKGVLMYVVQNRVGELVLIEAEHASDSWWVEVL